MTQRKLHGLKHFIAALGYSISGVRFALRESAIRQELALGGAHFIGLFVLQISFSFALFLSALWGWVVVVELINTALESVVDLASPEIHPLAKRAKDIASAAVFVALMLFSISWCAVIVKGML